MTVTTLTGTAVVSSTYVPVIKYVVLVGWFGSMQVAVAAKRVKNTAETDVKQSQFVCDTETGQKHDAVSILSL